MTGKIIFFNTMMEFSLKCVSFVSVSVLFFSIDCFKLFIWHRQHHFFQHDDGVYFEVCEFCECLSSLFINRLLSFFIWHRQHIFLNTMMQFTLKCVSCVSVSFLFFSQQTVVKNVYDRQNHFFNTTMQFSLKCVCFVSVSVLFFFPTDCLKVFDMT